eukprot:353688-Chlamydomonas_euryale.AAC.3
MAHTSPLCACRPHFQHPPPPRAHRNVPPGCTNKKQAKMHRPSLLACAAGMRIIHTPTLQPTTHRRPACRAGVYTLLASGALPPTHPEHPFTRRGGAVGEGAAFAKVPLTTAGLSLVSAHAAALGHEPPLTTKTATFAGCLDFVWASAAHWRVCRVLAMPYAMPRMRADAAAAAVAAAAAAATRPGVCSDSGHGSGSGVPGADDLVWMDPRADVEFPAIPDEHFPSDHLAVGAVLELVPPAWAAGPGA